MLSIKITAKTSLLISNIQIYMVLEWYLPDESPARTVPGPAHQIRPSQTLADDRLTWRAWKLTQEAVPLCNRKKFPSLAHNTQFNKWDIIMKIGHLTLPNMN